MSSGADEPFVMPNEPPSDAEIDEVGGLPSREPERWYDAVAGVWVVADRDYDRVVEELNTIRAALEHSFEDGRAMGDRRAEAAERMLKVVQQERVRAEEHEKLRAEEAERELELFTGPSSPWAACKAENDRLREVLREIARNWPDTDMTRERVEDLLVQSASAAERALAEPEGGENG